MKAIGIVLAAGTNNRMKELAKKRAIAAMPVAGSFRSVDFALSSYSNSRVEKVAVLTQYNSRSLNNHLSSSKWWDFGRKRGGLFVLTPTITVDNSFWYRGTADSIYQNLSYLKNSHEPYVIITSGDAIYKMDFDKIMEYHIQKKADITVVCSPIGDAKLDPSRYGFVGVDGDMKITSFVEKPFDQPEGIDLISCGIYIIRRRALIDMVEKSISEERYDFVKDIVTRYIDDKKLYAYTHTGYWRNISSIQSYYDVNMDFLKPEVRHYFFKEYPEVYSKEDDLPPAKYNASAVVKNSIVSSGSIINGTVENSVLFRNVYVGNGCIIKNSIIMNDVYIGDNTIIENCIVESRDTLSPNGVHRAEPGEVKVVVEKSERFHM